MKDPWNATELEIEAWAFMEDEVQPTQDWDLAVAKSDHSELILRLASDASCPNRFFFLHCLYLIVGDAAKNSFSYTQADEIDTLLNRTTAKSPIEITIWAQRSRNLIAAPASFVYTDWCSGILANMRDV
jgi:hypothetical protein